MNRTKRGRIGGIYRSKFSSSSKACPRAISASRAPVQLKDPRDFAFRFRAEHEMFSNGVTPGNVENDEKAKTSLATRPMLSGRTGHYPNLFGLGLACPLIRQVRYQLAGEGVDPLRPDLTEPLETFFFSFLFARMRRHVANGVEMSVELLLKNRFDEPFVNYCSTWFSRTDDDVT